MLILYSQDTVTHQTSDLKTRVTVSWSSPAEFTGQVYAVAAVVQDFSTYWVDLRSDNVLVTSLQSNNNHTAPPQPVETVTKPPKQRHSVYNSCSHTKTCFGFPGGCISDGDCDFMSTWVVQDNVTVIELYNRFGAGRYAAMALSQDEKMGEDFVISCVHTEGRPQVEHSWNSGKNNLAMMEVEGTKLIEGSITNGEDLYCKLERNNWIIGYPPIAGSGQFLYELDRGRYHILISGGTYTTTLTYHGPGMAQASMDKLDMTKITSVEKSVKILLKAHGILLVIAWLGCAGSGTVLARYFKDTWKDSTCCGHDQWFFWHRFFMILVWAATIAGVVCIGVHVRGWPYDKHFIMKNPHPVLGVAALVLTFIQPFIALCRPSPASSARWIFNWSHWFVGNSAHVIGIDINITHSMNINNCHTCSYHGNILCY